MGFEIQGFGTTASNYAQMRAQMDAVQEKTSEEKGTTNAEAKAAVENNQDKFVKSSNATAGTYSKNQLTSKQVSQLQADAEQRMNAFQQMLRSMLVKQGEKRDRKSVV